MNADDGNRTEGDDDMNEAVSDWLDNAAAILRDTAINATGATLRATATRGARLVDGMRDGPRDAAARLTRLKDLTRIMRDAADDEPADREFAGGIQWILDSPPAAARAIGDGRTRDDTARGA